MVRLFLFLFAVLCALPAAARQQQDMFAYGPPGYERPRVAEDYRRGSDLFNTSGFLMRAEAKDVFGRVEFGNPGYPDLFVPRRAQIPDDPLFNWPRRVRYR